MRKLYPVITLAAAVLMIPLDLFRGRIMSFAGRELPGAANITLSVFFAVLYFAFFVNCIVFTVYVSRGFTPLRCIAETLCVCVAILVLVLPHTKIYTVLNYDINFSKRDGITNMALNGGLPDPVGENEYLEPSFGASHTGTVKVRQGNDYFMALFYEYCGFFEDKVIIYMSGDMEKFFDNDFSSGSSDGYNCSLTNVWQITPGWYAATIKKTYK